MILKHFFHSNKDSPHFRLINQALRTLCQSNFTPLPFKHKKPSNIATFWTDNEMVILTQLLQGNPSIKMEKQAWGKIFLIVLIMTLFMSILFVCIWGIVSCSLCFVLPLVMIHNYSDSNCGLYCQANLIEDACLKTVFCFLKHGKWVEIFEYFFNELLMCVHWFLDSIEIECIVF